MDTLETLEADLNLIANKLIRRIIYNKVIALKQLDYEINKMLTQYVDRLIVKNNRTVENPLFIECKSHILSLIRSDDEISCFRSSVCEYKGVRYNLNDEYYYLKKYINPILAMDWKISVFFEDTK